MNNRAEQRSIELRGVEVHNLRAVDLDIPLGKLVVFCGVSGSGKTSLALDTLYAEGQRRYLESFSVYTRQFLQKLEKPQVERIDHLPAAIAVSHDDAARSSRSTIGTATETLDYLRLLMSKVAQLSCHQCCKAIRKASPATIASDLEKLDPQSKLMIGFMQPIVEGQTLEALTSHLRARGFSRGLLAGKSFALDTPPASLSADALEIGVIVDRVTPATSRQRLLDSLETAFGGGEGSVVIWREAAADDDRSQPTEIIDDRTWLRNDYSRRLYCKSCNISYNDPTPQLFSFNSPLGACSVCEGFGNTIDLDDDLIIPDRSKTLREGAVAPWNSPAYAHELEELLALAADYDLPVDIPYSELTERHKKIIRDGVPERAFGGLKGFFAWLERRKYKMHLRVFLSRWRSSKLCHGCGGARLNPESLSWKLAGKNISEITALRIDDAAQLFASLELTPTERKTARVMLDQLESRLTFLRKVGLGYLKLDRTLRTLSGGEAQRVALTSALGSSLVNMLYVLDEPSVGLHPADVNRLLDAVKSLRDRGNTVVLVEHEEQMLRESDWLVEVGPGAGDAGGQITFSGKLDEMLAGNTVTGDFLAGRRGVAVPQSRRTATRGWVKLSGARGNNLKNLTVEFPLGVLCLVTGVSGSGKSTLVQETLYGALCKRKHKESDAPLPYDDVVGDGQIDDVILVDQHPIGRSGRSNPVTYIKAFDPIRAVFAEQVDARTHNYTAGHFSFNVDGGRCPACSGEGFLRIDMQFLADVLRKCPACGGTRYRKEILQVKYRGRSIAEVLEMTAREAFSFFRGQPKVQGKLKQLIDVGLDYLRLGQPASTLSSGEAQRLKLAAFLSEASRNRTLFLLDEPTTGLHFADVVKLLDCFEALLDVGHSLIIVEHNLQLMRAADYLIDLGPGAGDAGGQIVVQGTPEQVTAHRTSLTGRYLAESLTQSQDDPDASSITAGSEQHP